MENKGSKHYFWLLLNILLGALVVNVVFFVMPALKHFSDSFQPARVINISSEGTAYVKPDIAETSFSVVSRGQDPSALTEGNNKKINAAIEFVKSAGIEVADIKTTGYYLAPDYQYNPDTGKSTITGYTLTQTVSLKIRDFDKVAKILAGLTPLGINQIGGLNFTVDDKEKPLAEARAEAFAKAREKAMAMAKQNGVRLGRVVTFSESSYNSPIPYFAKDQVFGRGATEATPPTIEPGTEELKVNVTVTYALD